MSVPSLRAFRDPASVAVVGASDNPAKWGYWLAGGALSAAHRRAVYLVNATASSIRGARAYPSLAALPETPELVVLCVPPHHVKGVVREALDQGARAFLGITAGVADEAAIGAMIIEAGARIIGPNSLGLYDADSELQLAWGNFRPGDLAIVSQSGQLGSEIAGLAARAGLGISRFISVGNQLDVRAVDLIEDLGDHDATRMVAVYLESFTDGARLVEVLRVLAAAGKPTFVLTTGASDGSQRLARSHTGSLTSALDTVDAACRASGAIRVATPSELVDLARYIGVGIKPGGRRLGVVSDSGGQGGIAADVASFNDLDVPILSDRLQSSLGKILPSGAAVSNPVDLAGAGEARLAIYADVVELLLRSGEVDAVVLSGYLGCYGEDTPAIANSELDVIDRLGVVVDDVGRPLVVHTMSAASPALERMWEQGVPAYNGIEFALRALSSAATLAASPGRKMLTPERSADAPPHGYWAARTFLTGLGIAVPNGVLVAQSEDVAREAPLLNYPVVLKAGWLEHKTELDGVVLGLGSIEQLVGAFDEMYGRLGDGDYVIEEQDVRPHTVEILVGARRDRDFGPVIVVGAGGRETELHRDVSIELAPVDRTTALSMIARLQCFALLQGWRGRPATDIDALAAIVVSVSEAIAANDAIADFEINPIRVAPDGALAVDALVLARAAVSR